MSKISSNNDINNYPKLRFSEFAQPWEKVTIKNIFDITRGYVLPTSAVKDKPYQDYTIPVYSSQTRDNGLMGYYNEFLYQDAITWTTDGANAGTVHFRSGKFFCTNVCGVLLNEHGYANRCVAEILGTISKKHVSYVGNPKLMNNVMAEIKINVPSLLEQKRIDEFICLLDTKIQKQNEYIELIRKYKQGIMQTVFDNDSKDMFGEIKYRKLIKLSELLAFQNGVNADASKYGKGVRYISVSDILKNDFITYDVIIGQVDIDEKTLESYSVTYGDILFQRSSETREDAGTSNVYLDKDKTATFGGFVIRGKKKAEYEPLYLKYALDSFSARKQIMRCAAGAQHINVSQDDLANVTINLPNMEVQKKIADFISKIDQRISAENKKRDAYIKLKKALLQQMFI